MSASIIPNGFSPEKFCNEMGIEITLSHSDEPRPLFPNSYSIRRASDGHIYCFGYVPNATFEQLHDQAIEKALSFVPWPNLLGELDNLTQSLSPKLKARSQDRKQVF